MTAVKLAMDIHEIWETMRRLHGNDFPRRVEELRPILGAAQAKHDVKLLAAAQLVAADLMREGHGMLALMTVAAAVEISQEGV